MRVRDRAEESVKLQQPGDKSFFSPSAGVCERGIKQRSEASRGRDESRLPAVTGAPGFHRTSRPQATKRTAGQDTLMDTYTDGLTQLTRGPPNLAATNTHSPSLQDTFCFSGLHRINRINPAMLV